MSTMRILGKLFGSAARVKILRFFLFNQDDIYERWEISEHTGVSSKKVSSELTILKNIGFVKQNSGVVEEDGKKVKIKGWMIDNKFPYLDSLKNFLLHTTALKGDDIKNTLKSVGKVKYLVLSGVFTQNEEVRIDILIVGDGIKQGMLKNGIKKLESELGKEINFAQFTTADFEYRQGIYDRLIRDVFDNPHKVLIDGRKQ